MGFLSRFNRPSIAADAGRSRVDAWDDFWYERHGMMSAAGVPVNADLALTLSAFWQGHRILTEGVASFPCHVHERLTNGGRKVADNHPVDDLIFRAPNPQSTAFEYWETTMSHLVLRGNAYAEITPGKRGFVDRLDLIHPDRVTVSRLPNRERQYKILKTNGESVRKYAEDIFHILGLSFDGLTGVSVITYAAQSVGTQLAAQRAQGRFFKQGLTAALAAIHPEELGDVGLKNLRESIAAYAQGLENSFGVLVLDEKIDLKPLGINPHDAQLLATQQDGVLSMARFLNIPPALLGDASTSTYASSRQFRQNLVDLTFRPWVERIEARIDAELFENPQRFFSKFNMGALLRGDPAEFATVSHTHVTDGTWTRNESRALQELNPLPGLDDPLQPLNMGTAQEQRQQQQRGGGAVAGVRSRAERIVERDALVIVRKEQRETARLAKAHASNAEAWQGALREFYAEHAKDVATRLDIPLPLAREYAAKQGAQLAEHGIDAAFDWEWTAAPALAALALREDLAGRASALEQEKTS
jgi:HK97 family phage portal protein